MIDPAPRTRLEKSVRRCRPKNLRHARVERNQSKAVERCYTGYRIQRLFDLIGTLGPKAQRCIPESEPPVSSGSAQAWLKPFAVLALPIQRERNDLGCPLPPYGRR